MRGVWRERGEKGQRGSIRGLSEVETDFFKRPLRDSRIIEIENKLKELESLVREDPSLRP